MVSKKKSLQTTAVKEYAETLAALKSQIQEAQVKAAFAVNRELLWFYWSIGKTISEKQKTSNWGSGVVEQLAKDLQKTFPGLEGFSRTNIFRIRAFYEAYEKVPQAVGQLDDLPIFKIPWGHNALLVEKINQLVWLNTKPNWWNRCRKI